MPRCRQAQPQPSMARTKAAHRSAPPVDGVGRITPTSPSKEMRNFFAISLTRQSRSPEAKDWNVRRPHHRAIRNQYDSHMCIEMEFLSGKNQIYTRLLGERSMRRIVCTTGISTARRVVDGGGDATRRVVSCRRRCWWWRRVVSSHR